MDIRARGQCDGVAAGRGVHELRLVDAGARQRERRLLIPVTTLTAVSTRRRLVFLPALRQRHTADELPASTLSRTSTDEGVTGGTASQFTAAATLIADFGAAATTISGTISGFRAEDGSSPGWAVTLHEKALGGQTTLGDAVPGGRRGAAA